MTLLETEPIGHDWTPVRSDALGSTPERVATASDLAHELARFEVVDLGDDVLPPLAAAAAELAIVSGISWRPLVDDAPVALLRFIAKVAIRTPQVGGTNTGRLVDQLRSIT